MGKGRKPTPLQLVDNKKDRKTKRELEKREKYEVGGCSALLEPPKELEGEALEEWNRIIPLYRELNMDILNDLDLNVLSAYCESVAIYKKAQKSYKKQPLIGIADGKVIENPYLKILSREGANIAKYAEQLCLSPVGRARMGVLGAKKELEDDPAAGFLTRYGYE